MNRRQFLGHTLGAIAGALGPGGLVPSAFGAGPVGYQRRKLILVTFGGGTRFSESIGDPEHRFIPRLWNEMVPCGTLFTDVRVEGRVVHTNCTASILTGHREYDQDNDWSRSAEHPTVFEIFRKSRRAPDTSAWAFVYASILSNAVHSRAAGFGLEYAPNTVEPPTIPRETAEQCGARLQQAAASGSRREELNAIQEAAQWIKEQSHINRSGLRSEIARQFLDHHFSAWRSGAGTTSHDAFLTDGAIACMKQFAPDVMMLAMGEIDCAHYGSWSRYVEAIQRTDELAFRLWRAAQELVAYRDRTLMLILPDHGRELERPGGMGYVHHSNFYTRENEDEGCRRVWMLMLGPEIASNRTVKKPVPQTATAATALDYLSLEASQGAAHSLLALGQ